MAFAIEWLAKWSRQDPDDLLGGLSADASRWLEPYRKLLRGDDAPPEPGSPLLSIFSRVRPRDDTEPPQRYWRSEALSLERAEPTEAAQARAADLAALWKGFAGELTQLLDLYEDESVRFQAFTHLLHKWAWAVPCSYGESGVSLYDEFRALSALVHVSCCAETPNDKFLLVGGDIPGIQDFVYTITSKGAAKGLRGRSFFVQLLGDAVVRRVLADLAMPETNVIYAAGGNFMLLVPPAKAEVKGKFVEERLEELQREIEGALLDVFEGDLALCLAWVPLKADQVGSHAFAQPVSKDLKGLIAERKRQRFRSIAKDRWRDLFGPQGKLGNRYCVICQRPLARGEGVPMEGESPDPVTGERPRRCSPCDGFKKLAERVGQEGLLAIGSKPLREGEPWQEALWQVGQVWYHYYSLEELELPSGSYFYTVNDTDFLANSAHGFRFVANVTPRVTKKDMERWRRDPEEGEEPPILCGIRTFGQMANVARGVRRLGVLRMDVDDLGQIMVQGLKPRTIAATSALSETLDRFFTGWLNRICAQVNQLHRVAEDGEDRGDRLYVIYAGGDDLFVVGSWDLMPELAKRIREQFKAYTGHNSALHISAGITLEGRKFPLYRAADQAGRAEDEAKRYSRNKVRKDAINFLGLPVKWDEWVKEVQPRWQIITGLVIPERAPRALLQVLQNIHAQYEEQVKRRSTALRGQGEPLPDEPQYEVYYGPWMWQEAYALTRMAERIRRTGDDEAARAVLDLQVSSVSPVSIRYVGLAARWAELLTREEKES